MITSAQVKENNGGGLQIECYDALDNIVAVISGIEYADNANGVDDLRGIVDGTWEYRDASQWYDSGGNSQGDQIDGRELTAKDAMDDHDTTKIIAEYDGKAMHIYIDDMGRAGQKYFNCQRN